MKSNYIKSTLLILAVMLPGIGSAESSSENHPKPLGNILDEAKVKLHEAQKADHDTEPLWGPKPRTNPHKALAVGSLAKKVLEEHKKEWEIRNHQAEIAAHGLKIHHQEHVAIAPPPMIAALEHARLDKEILKRALNAGLKNPVHFKPTPAGISVAAASSVPILSDRRGPNLAILDGRSHINIKKNTAVIDGTTMIRRP